MKLTIQPLSEADAAELASWRYDKPYDFYDGDADEDDLAELLDADRRGDRYWAARDADGTLAGFFYYARRRDALEIGLGLRPGLTGRGLGLEFCRAGLEFGRRHYRAERIVLNVAAFNERAIAVYERAGFRTTGRHVRQFERWGRVEFVEMEEQR